MHGMFFQYLRKFAEPVHVHKSLNGRLHQDMIALVMKYQRMTDEINQQQKKGKVKVKPGIKRPVNVRDSPPSPSPSPGLPSPRPASPSPVIRSKPQSSASVTSRPGSRPASVIRGPPSFTQELSDTGSTTPQPQPTLNESNFSETLNPPAQFW